MFIISKRNLMIQRPGENPYIIRKDYVGEIPEDIASHWLVRAAINDGTIATPQGKKDADLENADQEAAKKAEQSDIRPDAKNNTEQADMDGKENGNRSSKK